MAGNKLLVADDSLTIQKVIKLALANEDYEILTVSDGSEATEQISVFRPDAVLIDVFLPGQSAFEVKDAINSHSDLSHTRFILMSSAFEKVDEARAKEVGFDGRLTKPFDPANLRKVLNDVLDSEADQPPPESVVDLTSAPDEDLPPPITPEMDFTPPATPESEESTEAEVPPSLPTDITAESSDLGDLPPTDFPISFDDSTEDPEAPPSDFPVDIVENVTNEIESSPPDLPPEASQETDIRELTESTIQLSKLNESEFEWSVNENSMKDLTSLTPDESTDGPTQETEPALAPLAGHQDNGDSDFMPRNFDESSPFSMEPESPPEIEIDRDQTRPAIDLNQELEIPQSSESPPPPPAGSDFDPNVVPVTTEQMEQVLRSQLEGTIRELTEKMLPDIAERLIKEEINKLLNQQP